MKAEHRHELKTNALADTLSRLLQGIKAGPSRHALYFWGGLGVVVVAVALGYLWWKTNRDNSSALWVKVDDAERKLDDATNQADVDAALDNFKKIADEHPGETQSRVLRYERARALFHRGLERLYAEHDKGVEDLKQAREIYADLAKESASDKNDSALLVQEALMNVAKAHECLGEIEDAQKGYEKLAKAYPQSVLGKAADERFKYLSDDANRARVKQLYDNLGAMTRKSDEKPADTTGKKD